MARLKKIVALVLVSVMVLAFCGCGKKTVEGTWTGSMSDGTEVTYTFQADGNGSQNIGGIELACTYTAEDGKLTVSVPYFSMTKDTVYTYELKSKSLTLTPDDGEAFTLTKSESK